MLYTFTIYMVQCLRNYFIYQICRCTNIQPPFLYPSNGEKIFHKINQPHGIVVNIGVSLELGIFVKDFPFDKRLLALPEIEVGECEGHEKLPVEDLPEAVHFWQELPLPLSLWRFSHFPVTLHTHQESKAKCCSQKHPEAVGQ